MAQNTRQTNDDCDNLSKDRLFAQMRQSDTLDNEISSDIGQIASLLDEAEKEMEIKLRLIKNLRRLIKEKQQRKRQITEFCGYAARTAE